MKQLTLLIIIIASLLAGCTHSHQQANERIDSLYVQGDRYLNTDQWDSAMIVFSEAERLLNPHTEDIMRGKVYACLGCLWKINGNIPQALQYQEKALQAYVKAGNEDLSVLTLLKIGDYHLDFKTSEGHQKALEYIEHANTYSNINDTTRGNILQNKALVYFFSNQWDSAILYFHKAHAYPLQSTINCINRLYLGISHYNLEQFDSAKLYVKEAQKIPAGFRQRSGCCNMLYRIAKAEGDSMAAQHYASLLIAYKDSTMRLENAVSRQVVAIDSQADLVRDKQYKRQTALISGFIIVVLIVGCCVMRIRTRRHKTKEKQLQAVVQNTKQELLDEQIAHHQILKNSREEKIAQHVAQLQQLYPPTANWQEKQWKQIFRDLQLQNDSFVSNLHKKHPNLTNEDVRFCILIILNFSYSDIATCMNLATSTIGQKKNRIAAKIGVTIANLRDYLLQQYY